MIEWNYIAWAIPLFLLLIALEYFYTNKKGLPFYHLPQTVSSICIGLCERLTDLFTAALFYNWYAYIQTHHGLFQFQPGIVWWIVLLLLTDFMWYWYHRLAHEINVLWAVHVIHHSSEDYNYATATRITVLQAFVRFGFWSILPFLGFPAYMITALLVLHGVYPFFTHTQTIGKLGILEYFMVTPSHHRVHHANNPRYLDKNYGDMFIIWDKLFGTFQQEDEKPTYGLTKQLNSYSFLWQHAHFFIEIAVAVYYSKTWAERWRMIFGRPMYFNENARATAESIFGILPHEKKAASQQLNRYVLYQLVATAIFLFLLIGFEAYLSTGQQLLVAIAVLITLINIGAVLEQQRWVYYLEYFRSVVLVCLLLTIFPSWYLAIVISVVAVLVSTRFSQTEEKYLAMLYSR